MNRRRSSAVHGGSFWTALGADFAHLDRVEEIVTADVLDAWFPASPKVLQLIGQNLELACSMSPPVDAAGVVDSISKARGVPRESIYVSPGSSAIIFTALRHWLKPGSTALILDPMYGEYAHVLEQVIGCRVERFQLSPASGYQIDVGLLAAEICRLQPELVALVNPNSPTGVCLRKSELEELRKQIPQSTVLWIDETYIDFLDSTESLEGVAAASENVFVCKSMSKAYALSGLRIAYGVGPASLIAELRFISPPWALSLPGQMAAIAALSDEAYYQEQWTRTRSLRDLLASKVAELNLGRVLPGCANFVLLLLNESGPTAAEVAEAAAAQGVYLRDATSMGESMGAHALRIAVRDEEEIERIVASLLGTRGI